MLRQYADSTGHSVDLLLIGGLAMLAYGHPSRATIDVDGELHDHVRSLAEFLSHHHIPSNLGQSISGWSVVAMPPGYRDCATILIDDPGVRISLLVPVDFIIAKLRRGMDRRTIPHFLRPGPCRRGRSPGGLPRRHRAFPLPAHH